MAHVKLKHLRIEKYRNVAPGTELVFNDGFNVLLGQNGTGKTTLLNLIAMVMASRFGSLKETEFSLAYTLETTGAHVDVAIENARNDSPRAFDESFLWSYRVALHVDQLTFTCAVSVTPTQMVVSAGGKPGIGVDAPVNPFEKNLLSNALLLIMDRALDVFSASHVRTIFRFMEFEVQSIMNGGRFNELLGGLDSITGAIPSGDTPSASFQFVRPTNGSPPREREQATFVPAKLVERMKERGASSEALDWIVVEHQDIDFLGKAVQLMSFKKAHMLLRLRKKEPIEGGERLTFGDFEFSMTLDDNTVITHRFLSYGQKRLLAFLYYCAVNDVIIADEIVNGMHYDWIEACLREIGDRQSFLTSQNPLLLDFLPFATEQDVEHTFILCGNEQREGRRYLVWKNMPEESAQNFFRSYKTQALQVSEILRSRGWW